MFRCSDFECSVLTENGDQLSRSKQEKISTLKNTRYLWLKNRDKLKDIQKKELDELLKIDNLDTVIAYNYKLRLQELYENSKD